MSGKRITRLALALCIPLLLGGCLEAIDLVEEKVAGPRYCHTPTATTLCEPAKH